MNPTSVTELPTFDNMRLLFADDVPEQVEDFRDVIIRGGGLADLAEDIHEATGMMAQALIPYDAIVLDARILRRKLRQEDVPSTSVFNHDLMGNTNPDALADKVIDGLKQMHKTAQYEGVRFYFSHHMKDYPSTRILFLTNQDVAELRKHFPTLPAEVPVLDKYDRFLTNIWAIHRLLNS